MPREIVIGNGKILVNLDKNLSIRDFYYPYVGMENHVGGYSSGIGVWVDGTFSWLSAAGWQKEVGYERDALVGRAKVWHEEKGLELNFKMAVHYQKNIYLKIVRVKNLRGTPREVRVFFNGDFSLGGSDVGDTAFYHPATGAVVHYKKNYYFLIKGGTGRYGLYQYTTGIKRFGHREGTWRDAEDGQLSMQPVAQGSVDSTVSVRACLAPGAEAEMYFFIAVGGDLEEIKQLHDYVLRQGPSELVESTRIYWYRWVNRQERDFGDLSNEAAGLFKLSLLITRSQIDDRGAVIAANDTDIMVTNRDNYSYLWPRDGALVSHALDRAGYPEVTRPFFYLCPRLLSGAGFMWPKYHPDGTIGSNWHPWLADGVEQLPIQEDETALVLWALWEHYCLYREQELIRDLYYPLVVPAADFMAAYRDGKTGLPLESYDLWEERRGVFTFTASAVYGGLQGAVQCARLMGDEGRAFRWQEAADEVRRGILKYLFNDNLGRFIRGFYRDREGNIAEDYTLESSLAGVFKFGVLKAGHPWVAATMRSVREGLWVKTGVGGLARYTDDYYFRRSDDVESVPGNPWFVCTLWLAEWYVEAAVSEADLEPARIILEWVPRRALESGVLAEQIHPYTGEPLSVAPLTWSHSTYVLAVVKYLEKLDSLKKAGKN